MNTTLPTIAEAEKLNITSKEYDRIKEMLQRAPNALELELFSILWSEHARSKNSRKWLTMADLHHDNILIKATEERAGAVDLGDGNACVFKVGSHNRPCAIQPRLGASTGLRVVMRDIFSMGAKPMAFLSSLRFGDGKRDTARWLFEEVATGISEFESGFGVPIVGGETLFSKGYNTTPIVNNMAIGVAPKSQLLSGKANGKGNLVLIVGARTGKDGIDVDVFETELLTEIDSAPVSMEQMMDVTVEKELLEAVQQLNSKVSLVGVQPLGNQGVIGAALKMAAIGKVGISIDTECIPQRNEGLTERDLLLSQTWGRLLICVAPEDLDAVKEVIQKLEVAMAVIGQVTDTDSVICNYKSEKVAEVPVSTMTLGNESPIAEQSKSVSKDKAPDINLDIYDEPDHYPEVIKLMLANLNVTSKRWLTSQFNQTNNEEDTDIEFPSDAAFIHIEGSDKALAATMDCNSRYMKADAFRGAQIAVAEAARNIVCAGGRPLGLADCLNFGNAVDADVYTSFIDSLNGISEASKDFNIPVIGRNVSFNNQRSEIGQLTPVTPTPVIGMVGVVDDKKLHSTLSFRHKGDMIFIIGESRNDVNSSEYASSILNIKKSAAPYYNAQEERELHSAVAGVIQKKLVRSVHDVSNGGLFFSLLECAIPLEFGFDITSDAEIRKEAFLFGESQSRVVVSVAPSQQDNFVDYMMETNVPFSVLGHVTKGEIRVDDESFGYIGDLKVVFEERLKNWVEGE